MKTNLQSDRPSKTEFAVALVGLFLCAVTLGFPKLIDLLPREEVQTSSMSLRYTGEPILLGERREICEAVSANRTVIINVRGRINELRNYQNLFQTGSQNAGIRVEIDDRGTVGLIVANRSELTFASLASSGTITPGRIQMRFVLRDGKLMTNQVGASISTGILADPQPTCNDVVVGYGFDSSRRTDGNYRIDITTFTERPRFVGFRFEELMRNEFVRSLSLALLIFFFLLSVLNISDRLPKQATANSPSTEDQQAESERTQSSAK